MSSFCMPMLKELHDLVNCCLVQVLRHEVGRVEHILDLVDAQPFVVDLVLKPKLIHCNVSDLAEPFSGGDRSPSCGISE